MLESFLSDLCFIKDALDKDRATLFFDKEFSFFSSAPVVFYQPAGDRIIYLNRCFTDSFGYTSSDIKNWNLSLQPLLLLPDEASVFMERMQEADPDTLTPKGYHIFSKNGMQDIFRIKVTPLYKGLFSLEFQDGQPKDYAKLLQEKIEELNKSNAELEEFAYVASHDMQEPLRKISTFGQRLKNQCGDSLGEDGNLYLSRMLNASDNMRKLIDNLLEFSRVSRNKQAFETIDLNSVLKNVTEDLDMQIDEADASLSIDPMPELQAISSQMRQLFFNLLNNALKFRSKERSLVVNVKCRILKSPEVKKYDLPNVHSQYFLITVSDNGIGFEQQYAERIFQLFQRLEGKSEYPGTGIGLSICRKIVQNHKGLIFAESEPGEGTVFSIILPKDQ